MKISCDMVKDLMLLYENGDCSQDSRRAVEEHLTECAACRQYLEVLKLPEALTAPEVTVETEQEVKAVKHSFRKIKKRWISSLVSVAMVLPVILLLMLGVNQLRGQEICFTNLDDIWRTRQYLSQIRKENWDTVAEMTDYSLDYDSLVESLADRPTDPWPLFALNNDPDMTLEEYSALKRGWLAEALEEYQASGAKVVRFRYIGSYNADGWSVEYALTEETADGRQISTCPTFKVVGKNVVYDGGQSEDSPLCQAIDRGLHHDAYSYFR